MEWKDIKDAPKDGTTVWLCWFDQGEGPFDVCKMRWDLAATSWMLGGIFGMWISVDGIATWCDSEGNGPTHFAWCN